MENSVRICKINVKKKNLNKDIESIDNEALKLNMHHWQLSVTSYFQWNKTV